MQYTHSTLSLWPAGSDLIPLPSSGMIHASIKPGLDSGSYQLIPASGPPVTSLQQAKDRVVDGDLVRVLRMKDFCTARYCGKTKGGSRHLCGVSPISFHYYLL